MIKHSFYSLGEAAKATGKAKGTIKNAITKGRLSASKNEIGEYEIDPAELHRVYKPLNTEQGKLNAVTPSPVTTIMPSEKEAYEAQIAMLREMVEMLKTDKEDWKRQAEAGQRLLENQSRTAQKSPSGGLFGFFRRSA